MSKTFAQISNDNVVVNVLIANSKEDAELASNATCIEYDENKIASIGDTYNAELDEFISPEPVIVEPLAIEEPQA